MENVTGEMENARWEQLFHLHFPSYMKTMPLHMAML